MLLTDGMARWFSWPISRNHWLNRFGTHAFSIRRTRSAPVSCFRGEDGGQREDPHPRRLCCAEAGSGILHQHALRGDEQWRAGLHFGQSCESRMIDCRTALADGDVVCRHNHREVPLDRCPMQRIIDLFQPASCGNGSSVLHPGALHELDEAGEARRLVDGYVFAEEHRLRVRYRPRRGA